MEITKIDFHDLGLLRTLQHNGRATISELAETVRLSPTPVARRLGMLEDAGVITGYTALIAEAALGYGFSAFVSVKMDRQVDDVLAEFEATIRNFPEVVDCWLMTGHRDYLLRISTRGPDDFEQFMTGTFNRLPGVASIESTIPLRRVKADHMRRIER